MPERPELQPLSGCGGEGQIKILVGERTVKLAASDVASRESVAARSVVHIDCQDTVVVRSAVIHHQAECRSAIAGRDGGRIRAVAHVPP